MLYSLCFNIKVTLVISGIFESLINNNINKIRINIKKMELLIYSNVSQAMKNHKG